MKNLVWVLLLVMVASCAKKADNVINITGKVKFPDNNYKMEIIKRDGFDKIVVDSFAVNSDNTFSYTMTVDEPGVYYLDCQKWQGVSFWAEDEDVEINFRGQDTAKIKIKNPPYVYIKGGELNDVMNSLNYNSYRNYQLMIGLAQSAYRNLNKIPEYGPMIGDVYSVLGDDDYARTKFLAKRYADRKSVLAVLSRLNSEKDAELIKDVLATLEAKHPNYGPVVKYKKEVIEKLEAKARVEIGKVAPDFACPDTDGKMVGPKDYRGKYLLIDFWASWCGPCRNEIPNVKKLYDEYKDKGLEVLSVSIDKKEADWLDALEVEEMAWKQVRAPKSGKDVMKLYQFSGIPHIVLLDKEGKIVARGLRGEKMEKMIEEIFTK